MKLHLSCFALVLLAGAVADAHANTADLTVTGTIVPPSCTIALSNGGTIDLGQVNLSTLDPLAPTDLTAKTLNVTITCATAAKVATMATEDRPGTSSTAGNAYFGLGNTVDGNPIGHYLVFATGGTVDAAASAAIGSTNTVTWTAPAGGVPVEHTNNRYTSVGATATGPAAGTTLAWTLRFEPTIASSSSLALTGSQAIDGQMTLTLVYL